MAEAAARRRGRVTPAPLRECAVEDLVPPDPKAQNYFAKVQSRSKPATNVVVVGVTGSGKSAVINALCGAVPVEEVEYDETGTPLESELPAKEGHSLKHETKDVASYLAQKASLSGKIYTVNVWDTPGLQDGKDRGCTYMDQFRIECEGGVDILLYCVNVSEEKCIPDNMVPGMREVTDSMGGPDVWRHAIIVLTFANELEENIKEELSDEDKEEEEVKRIFASRISKWQNGVRSALKKAGVPGVIASEVPVEPAGYYLEPNLPDREYWLGSLWLHFFHYARDEAKMALIVTNQHRIKDARNIPSEQVRAQLQSKSGEEIPIVLKYDWILSVGATTTTVGGAGAVIGKLVGGSLGVKISALIGATAGAGLGLAAGVFIVAPLVVFAVHRVLRKDKVE